MKPDWKDAPEWANYLAMDSDGAWCWFEHEPIIERDDDQCWTTILDNEQYLIVPETRSFWKNSLEQRP